MYTVYLLKTGEPYIWTGNEKVHICYLDPEISDAEQLNQLVNEVFGIEPRDEPWSKPDDWWSRNAATIWRTTRLLIEEPLQGLIFGTVDPPEFQIVLRSAGFTGSLG
jgi:hypothetical protein